MLVSDVVCPFCGCLCDDLELEVEPDQGSPGAERLCPCRGNLHERYPAEGPDPAHTCGWENISYDEAIRETADILREADRPLLYGWSSTHGEAQSIGVHIAERIGAVIDNTSTVCHGPSILAIQEVGHPGLYPRPGEKPCGCGHILGVQPDRSTPATHEQVYHICNRLLCP